MPPRPRRLFALAWLALCMVGAGGADPAPQADPASRPADLDAPDDDATHLPTLEFPGHRVRDAVRLHFLSRFVPDAGVGDGHTSLYRPELRGRVTLPLSERGVLRISGLGGMGRYEFRGSDFFFDDSLDVYETHLSVQGAYLLNDQGFSLLREGERWSLMAGIQGGSDFESGAFDDGLWGSGGLGLGFELPRKLQVAAGVSVETTALGGGVGVSPAGSFRWDATETVTLRNRGMGLQLEYHWSPALELFVSGFRETDQYVLEPTFCPSGLCGGPTQLDDLRLQDRMLLTGVGFEWKLSPMLRLNSELGAVAWRRLRVRSEDLGTIVSHRGDPAFYFELRLEVRP